jgi:hypothetical protein
MHGLVRLGDSVYRATGRGDAGERWATDAVEPRPGRPDLADRRDDLGYVHDRL